MQVHPEIVEMLSDKRQQYLRLAEDCERAIAAIRPATSSEAPAPKRARKAKAVRVTEGANPALVKPKRAKASAKRGPDSDLTKAKKRIASAKRFGKEPAAADLDLVSSQAAE
jgi:hypothetical protein